MVNHPPIDNPVVRAARIHIPSRWSRRRTTALAGAGTGAGFAREAHKLDRRQVVTGPTLDRVIIIAVLLGCALRQSAGAALTDGRSSGGCMPEARVAAGRADTPELTSELGSKSAVTGFRFSVPARRRVAPQAPHSVPMFNAS